MYLSICSMLLKENFTWFTQEVIIDVYEFTHLTTFVEMLSLLENKRNCRNVEITRSFPQNNFVHG